MQRKRESQKKKGKQNKSQNVEETGGKKANERN